MPRITKDDLKYHLQRWCDATGNRPAKSWNDVGGVRLDNNPTYGGVVIERIVTSGGGVLQVYHRMPPRQFCEAVQFLLASPHREPDLTGNSDPS